MPYRTSVGALALALSPEDAMVRMRAGDALEKICLTNPEYLEPHRSFLLGLAAATEQPSLRWHLAQMIPRLPLETRERRSMVSVFKRYLDDSSAIVKTSAMQAITEFAVVDPALRRTVIPLLRALVATGSASMRVRGGRLLEILEQHKGRRAR